MPDPNVSGAGERRPIHRAAGANHCEIIKYLISKGAMVNQPDKSKRTALHWAAISGHAEAGKVLFEAGCDIFARTVSGTTALHAAAEAGRVEFVEFLLEHLGDRKRELLDAKDSDGKVAYELAATVR